MLATLLCYTGSGPWLHCGGTPTVASRRRSDGRGSHMAALEGEETPALPVIYTVTPIFF